MKQFSRQNNRIRSQNQNVAAFERLESRQMLVYLAADYFPQSGGNTWNYSGTENGVAASSAVISTANVPEGGASTTRFSTQFTSSAALSRTALNYLSLTADGVRWYRSDSTFLQSGVTTIVRFAVGGALKFPASFDIGQDFSYSAPYTSGSGGRAGSGELSGTISFSGPEQVVTPSGTFSAIKVSESAVDTGQINGISYTTTITSSSWLVRGLASVRIVLAQHATTSNGGDLTIATDISLTGSSLLRPILSLSGNTLSIGAGDTSPSTTDGTNFSSIEARFGFRTSDFTLTNTGFQPLTFNGISPISISGTSTLQFVVISQPEGTLAPGASVQFSIRFIPAGQVGLSTATVTIASTAPATPSYRFAIQGTGLALPHAQISGNRLDIASGDTTPTTADWSKFAGIDALYGNKVRIFTITNTGLATLNLAGTTSVTLSGPNSDRFAVFVQPAATLAPGASTQFRVRFIPAGQVGFGNATLSVATSDPVTPLYTFAIQGNGLALPRAQISSAGINIASGDGTPDPADKTDFGSVLSSGTNNRVRLFTITNIGLANLTLTGLNFVRVTGPNASDFTVSTQPTSSTLAPGASITFRVRFDPLATGMRLATLVLDTNENLNFSPSAGHYNFAIAGTGT